MLRHEADRRSTRNWAPDSRVFRKKVYRGEAEIFVVVHVDDVIVAARDTATLEGSVVELRAKFAIKRRQLLYWVSCNVFPGGRYNAVQSAY